MSWFVVTDDGEFFNTRLFCQQAGRSDLAFVDFLTSKAYNDRMDELKKETGKRDKDFFYKMFYLKDDFLDIFLKWLDCEDITKVITKLRSMEH